MARTKQALLGNACVLYKGPPVFFEKTPGALTPTPKVVDELGDDSRTPKH